MDDDTRSVYDQSADTYHRNRPPIWLDAADRFLDRAIDARAIIDQGCGTGVYLGSLSRHPGGVVGVDRSRSMLTLITSSSEQRLVVAEHAHAPIRSGSVGGVWARHSYVHEPHEQMPMLLRELRRVMADGAPLSLSMVARRRDQFATAVADGDLPGRRFFFWHADHLDDLATAAGFVALPRETRLASVVKKSVDGQDATCLWVEAVRTRSIADTVGPGMRLLVCGLNPSLHAADADIGFVTPGNRFWPAAIEAGLASRDRDPEHALMQHGLGMTDLVKRATPRAAELTTSEYEAGLERLDRLVRWLEPGAVCFVGLAGWRAAVDRNAKPGPQERTVGGRPVYVMPSTSGLNASSQHADFVMHFHDSLRLADQTR